RSQAGPRPQVPDRGSDDAPAASVRRPARRDAYAPAHTQPAGWVRRIQAKTAGPQLQPPDRQPRMLPGLGRGPAAARRLAAWPRAAARRRETDRRLPFLFAPARARRLLDAAAALPDNSRAAGRGRAYHAIFALCYGLGLRAGEACGLRVGDVDPNRQLL